MKIKWQCDACEMLLDGNPLKCPRCGWTVYRQLAEPDTPADDELLRLRRELDAAQTMVAELEGVIGTTLVHALRAGHDRVERGQPYALVEVLENLRGAFHKVAEDRNMWRARAKRAADVARGRE